MTAELVSREQRIPPSRGLVVAHSRRNVALALIDIRRWLRYTRLVYKSDQLDVLANGAAAAVVYDLVDNAEELELALSLRTDASAPPIDFSRLADTRFHDVFLCPDNLSGGHTEAWLDACKKHDIPLRLQLRAPFDDDRAPQKIATELANRGVRMVHLALFDPFANPRTIVGSADQERALARAQDLARSLEEAGVEATITGVPLCLLHESSLIRAANSRQLALDHNAYIGPSAELATKLFDRRPFVSGKVIRMMLSRHTLRKQPMDNILLPWLLHHHYFYLVERIWRRLTNHLNISGSVPAEAGASEFQKALAQSRKRVDNEMGKDCGGCAWLRICDHQTHEFRAALPGVRVRPVEGETVASPLHFCALQPKYYDVLDAERRDAEARHETLAEEAARIITTRPPDRSLGSAHYEVEDTHFDRMEGGIKWWSVSNSEKLSTPLGRFTPPLTISVDFGAGIADYVGFSLGRHCKIVCPMEGYRHNITLHIDAEGQYVLLRDKHPVRPTEFEGQHYLPLRLGDELEPRISVWNIDECIATQNVRVWEGLSESEDLSRIKYSVIIVSTRFTRRLHAVLRSLGHQRGFDLSTVEVIICYVPGIDATDDLIDGVSLAYPEIRFVRSPFPEQYMNSKGFLINETRKIARGEWIMLLDSDTLLAPDYLARVEEVSDDAEFIAPDGRRLLTKELTAKILMGELDPWDHWRELLEGNGEFRHRETLGVPVGFCQCFRAKYLDEFPYLEVDHFETADMYFGMEMRKHIGIETRLSGSPVIHLDHGGSQWYGTQKHM